jgi:hypothetical protein
LLVAVGVGVVEASAAAVTGEQLGVGRAVAPAGSEQCHTAVWVDNHFARSGMFRRSVGVWENRVTESTCPES